MIAAARFPVYLAALLAFVIFAGVVKSDTGLKRAESFVEDLVGEAIAIRRDGSLSDAERLRQFDALVSQKFDMPWIGRFALGRNFSRATSGQQEEYLSLFQQVVLYTYYNRFDDFLEFQSQIKGSRIGKNGKYIFVTSRFYKQNQSDSGAVVVWRLLQHDDSFKIIDIAIEGVSMAITQRKEYDAVIGRNGGDVAALIAAIREKIEKSKPNL